MDSRDMLSVGIDVGTTTSQLVLSELTVSNQARAGLVPRLDIDARRVLYQSEPHLTPLHTADEVDVERLVELIRAEYRRAGVEPSQVETGAVIITGETARARNAEEILRGLGDLAGEFVVTVAGPNLESQIAGRGSGAAQWSAANYATVINVDIGGGSSNAALFRSGGHVASAASMVGGRQAVLDASSGVLTHLAPIGRMLTRELGLDLREGSVPRLEELRRLTDAMAEIIVELCLGETSPLAAEAALSPPLAVDGSVGAYFVSGGVGALYYDKAPARTLSEVIRWGDVGPLLADSLRRNARWSALRVEQPEQTLRATVLGAASQQVTLSGSTIWAEDSHLPLRNAPVIEPRLQDSVPGLDDGPAIAEALGVAVERWDRGDGAEGDFAVSLDLPQRLTYPQVTALARGICSFAVRHLPPGRPLVLVTEADYAQVLGQTIKQDLPEVPLIVVDQIHLGEGDFIDIGEPLFDGRVVPVSVKTLIFYQAAETEKHNHQTSAGKTGS
ncbi:ethanolamine ammonia-lyase reactivating factor EutA [Tessaracoccus sp. MC1756]|uniref:ethanolamine ammonia-lyase reactivating factor EutA n=1 Tax=Tessaracoccus sp. MC1756 TaxID=2760311 RepID=UPI0016048B22|nr:ethanolamine ammonia-lyase reactivating factor EutA [Tessaracoccus sp. MC1756]MBB1508863.1 ethanolamine ammonia-lyase reactivating factor EutA [Tessaracoccus sp. MC1756]